MQRPHLSKRTFRFENAYKLETDFDIWLRRVGKGTWINMCFIDYICAHKPCLLGAGNIVIRWNSKVRIVVASWIILVALVHGRIGFKCGFYERGWTCWCGNMMRNGDNEQKHIGKTTTIETQLFFTRVQRLGKRLIKLCTLRIIKVTKLLALKVCAPLQKNYCFYLFQPRDNIIAPVIDVVQCTVTLKDINCLQNPSPKRNSV